MQVVLIAAYAIPREDFQVGEPGRSVMRVRCAFVGLYQDISNRSMNT